MEDGVYFNLLEDEYHAEQRLSASGIKWLHVSPEDFWARSWMNPIKEVKETKFMEMGSAYHKRILEGREAFYTEYASAIDPDDYPGALRTATDLKAALKDLGQTQTGNKDVLIDRLLTCDSEAVILDRIIEDHAIANEGKILLSAELIMRIEYSSKFIESHPALAKAFKGGYPEVSVLWTDEKTGIQMKSRFDYLKINANVDLKTFSNSQGKVLETAIYHALAYNRYHIQAAVYTEARKQSVKLIKDGKHDECDPEWLEKFVKSEKSTFLFVFQQTGIAPLARGWVLPEDQMTMGAGDAIMLQEMEKFKEMSQRYGTDPWLDGMELEKFDDEFMPRAAFE